jgi:hypothetical protein
MAEPSPFGRSALHAKSASALIDLEASAGKATSFAELDTLITTLVRTALKGERLVKISRGRDVDAVRIEGLRVGQRQLLDSRFSLEHQQARGAWFLPDETRLKIGVINLPGHFRRHPRFFNNIVAEERCKVRLGSSADAVFVWSVLEPLFSQLLMPLELRGPQVGVRDADRQRQDWATVDHFYEVLGIDAAEPLATMGSGRGWSRLRAIEQVQAKQRLLDVLADRTENIGASYRASCTRALLARYYERAKRRPPTRQQVVTKHLERTLAGFFGGDWLAFLNYLDEAPHPDDRIVTALPETRVFAGRDARAVEVAQQQGLPVEEVRRMLATLWGGESSVSPVERRVATLRRFWSLFDDIHSRQAPGMPPLWGLVEDTRSIMFSGGDGSPYQNQLYRRLLPVDLVSEVDELWAGTMFPRWPDRIVSEPFPHALMAEAFGPALTFWHGCALTAWFLCEGPSSRTDIAGLPRYHEREMAELAELGCPIDVGMFNELSSVRLGPERPITQKSSTAETETAIGFDIQLQIGTRRSGFERLRDVITRHRRLWAERYFEAYLQARCDLEIRAAGREHSRRLEESGKPPTAKQFAKHAASPANHWFGGNMADLYGALGERAPVKPQRVCLMPSDRIAFVRTVFEYLGGRPFVRQSVVGSAAEARRQNDEQQQHHQLSRLADESLRFVQLEEAFGRSPELKEFGSARFEGMGTALSSNIEAAWLAYRSAIESARQQVRR